MITTTGPAQLSFTLPLPRNTAGACLFFQHIAFAPTQPGGISASNGGQLVVGF